MAFSLATSESKTKSKTTTTSFDREGNIISKTVSRSKSTSHSEQAVDESEDDEIQVRDIEEFYR